MPIVNESKNIVSDPPLASAPIGMDGKFTRPWARWFQTLYQRTSYKGGNAIDETITAVNQNNTVTGINSEDIITNANNIQTNVTNIAENFNLIGINTLAIGANTTNIATNTADIATNAAGIATNASNISTNAADIATNAADIADLQIERVRFGLIKAIMIEFEGINTVAAVTPGFSYNVDTFERISTGVYEGSVLQSTFFGVNIFTQSVPVFAHSIAASANTDFFEIEFTDLGSGDFRIEVYEITVGAGGAGSDLVRTLYDPDTTGDSVSMTLMADLSAGELPPA